jgi:hypothetical protein
VVTLQAGETGEGSVLLGFDEHVGPNPSVAVFFFLTERSSRFTLLPDPCVDPRKKVRCLTFVLQVHLATD